MNAKTTKQPKVYPNTPAPAVCQVWEDTDPRMRQRRVRIERIVKPLDPKMGAPYAECAVISTSGRANKHTKIRLDRFKPTSTGWKYIEG